MAYIYKNCSFLAEKGDIAAQKGIDAVVNAANAQLATGGGVAGAIHKTAGQNYMRSARLLLPLLPGKPL